MIMQDAPADRELAQAIETNGADFLIALGCAGGGEQRDDALARWTIGGSPIDYHNAVVHASLTRETADTVIGESLERLRAHAVPGTWHVGPSMRPADLGARLLAHGFSYAGDDIGMAVDLAALSEVALGPPRLAIERVGREQELDIWVRTLAAGFGEGEREAAWVGEMYRRLGLAEGGPWHHYLGWLDGRAVATASLFLSAGAAGIYFVFTIPEARRQGIGAAITLAALRHARSLGTQIGVLGASQMGYNVYRQLGFREYCRIAIYEWRPPESG